METAVGEKNKVPERKKHFLDVHCTLPLFFKRYYIVFSSGTDHRKNKEGCPDFDHRVKTLARDIAFVLVGLLCFSSFFGTIIYKLLQKMG
jgi:hypothetical protein